jgi:hypothetical protein
MIPDSPNPACTKFESLLADALDDVETERARGWMQTHASSCADCRQLLDLARLGKQWLGTMEVVVPPANLVHNILAATSAESAPLAPRRGERDRVRRSPLSVAWSALRAWSSEPRLVMTAAMAFFSLSMLANVTGTTLGDLRELKPSTLATRTSLRYHEVTAGVVRFYDNNTYLRELEVRLEVLRDAAAGAEGDDAAPRSAPPKGSEQEPHAPAHVAAARQEDRIHG